MALIRLNTSIMVKFIQNNRDKKLGSDFDSVEKKFGYYQIDRTVDLRNVRKMMEIEFGLSKCIWHTDIALAFMKVFQELTRNNPCIQKLVFEKSQCGDFLHIKFRVVFIPLSKKP